MEHKETLDEMCARHDAEERRLFDELRSRGQLDLDGFDRLRDLVRDNAGKERVLAERR